MNVITAATRAPIGPRPLDEVADGLGIPTTLLEPWGDGVAKLRDGTAAAVADRTPGRYVVVTAVTPTPLGEGKTVTTIGLGDALRRLGVRSAVSLRQGSIGPTLGVKGSGAGGGRCRLHPFERAALHLTGDLEAVAAAHNLLAAMIDNRLFHGDDLDIDPHSVSWRRVLDVDDRALRNIVVGLGGEQDGVPRQSGFDITAASEVMAILALATSLDDLRARLGRIIVARTHDGEPVTAEQVRAAGAMAVLLRDAVKPNLLQTAEGTPTLVHAGPFGNIAHGNSSVIADRIAVHAAEVLVTEAGFGADMGAERFFNIKCRTGGLRPSAAVVVATVRALKVHSGRHHVVSGRPLPAAMLEERPDEVREGAANLRKQIENVRVHGVPVVVAINLHDRDHPSEVEALREAAAAAGARVAVSRAFHTGGAGALELAEQVLEAAAEPSTPRLLYPDEASLRQKVSAIAGTIYGAAGVTYARAAERELDRCEHDGLGRLPVCIAKTHLSISSDPALTGAPTGWTLPIREARAAAGAGFVYLVAGDMRTMPGMPTHPAAETLDVDADGHITGLH